MVATAFNEATKAFWYYLVGKEIGVNEIDTDEILRLYMEMDGVPGDITWPGAALGSVSKGVVFVDVKDYGAKGDNATDDRPAIQAAIDAVSAQGGGTVYFPKGIYLIRASGLGLGLTLTSGVRLVGHSRRTTTIRCADTNINGVQMLGASAASTVVQTTIEHMALSGPGKTSGGTGSAIYIKWASVDVLLDSLWITNWGNHGVESIDSYSMSFVRCLFDSNGNDGFNGTTNQNNLTFDRCISINNNGRGYSVVGGTTIKFLNCDAESNQGSGFDIRYVTAPSIDTCHLEQNGKNGTSPNIYLHFRASVAEKTVAASIVNTLIQGAGVTVRGLVLDGTSRTNVIGNWFSNHVTDHVQTTANCDRTWLGPNTYLGTGNELTDGSATTVRMDYDYANGCARTDVLRYVPKATNPAILAQGQVWVASGTDQLKYRDATTIRTIYTGFQSTATLDFPSIPAGTVAELTVTVTGVVAGDSVTVAPPITLNAGLIVSGFVSAANTVTVRVFNGTAAAIDPASAGWKINVIRS